MRGLPRSARGRRPLGFARLLSVRAPRDDINIKILQSMISGIPLIVGLRTRMRDSYVYAVFEIPIDAWEDDLGERFSRLKRATIRIPQG